eukprot:c10000_g1_i1.p1 GENE.c10000_g1_i1~~c10000_g1_i1.p1  ORF type:complete len:1030 (-),score=259.68 c10000_g1_i1:15-3104(-)
MSNPNESDPAWLLDVLARDRGQWQQFAAGAIQNLALNSENRVKLVKEYNAVPVLIDSARNDPGKVREFSCGALWGCAGVDENRETLLQNGIMDLICFVLRDDNSKACDNICGCLSSLASSEEIAKKILDGDLGNVMSVVLDVLQTCLRGEGESQMLVVPENKLEGLCGFFWTLSNSKSIRQQLCSVPSLLPAIVRVMEFGIRQNRNQSKIGERSCELCCSVIHSLAQYDANHDTLTQCPNLVVCLADVMTLFPLRTVHFATSALHLMARNIPDSSVDAVLTACVDRLSRDISDSTDKETDAKIIEATMGVLFGVSFGEKNRDIVMTKPHVLKHILEAGTSREGRMQEYAVGCLWGLSSPEQYRLTLVKNFNTLEILGQVLSSSKARDRTKESACWTLQNLTCDDPCKELVIENDTIMASMDQICRTTCPPEVRTQEIVCNVLHQMASHAECRLKMVADYDVVGALHHLLRNPDVQNKAKVKASSTMWLLATVKETKGEILKEPALLDTFCSLIAEDNGKIRRGLVLCLLHLSEHKLNKAQLAEHSGVIAAMVPVIRSDDAKAREVACGVLSALSFYEPAKPKIVDSEGVINALGSVLSDPAQPQARLYAMTAIWAVSFADEVKFRLATQVNAHIPLLNMLKLGCTGKLLEYSCACLQNLTIEKSNRPFLVAQSEIVDVLTQVVVDRTEEGRAAMEAAMGTLQNLSIDESNRLEMAKPEHPLVATFLELVMDTYKVQVAPKSHHTHTGPDVPTLSISLVSDDPPVTVVPPECEIALATLKNLSIAQENKQLFATHYGMVAPLNEVVKTTQGKARKLAYQVLRNLPLTDEQVAELAAIFKKNPDSDMMLSARSDNGFNPMRRDTMLPPSPSPEADRRLSLTVQTANAPSADDFVLPSAKKSSREPLESVREQPAQVIPPSARQDTDTLSPQPITPRRFSLVNRFLLFSPRSARGEKKDKEEKKSDGKEKEEKRKEKEEKEKAKEKEKEEKEKAKEREKEEKRKEKAREKEEKEREKEMKKKQKEERKKSTK